MSNSTKLFDGRAFIAGARACLPLAIPAVFMGITLGVYIADTVEVSDLAGWSSSWIVFAGSSQLAAIRMLAEGAPAVAIIISIAMINARHIPYSAAIAPRLGKVPMWVQLLGSYLLLDQVFALDEILDDSISKSERVSRLLGAGVLLWTIWQLTVGIGVLSANAIPIDFPINFVVAVMFGGLMVLSIRDRAGVIAAVVGASVAIAARNAAPGVAVVAAIIVGSASGYFSNRMMGNEKS